MNLCVCEYDCLRVCTQYRLGNLWRKVVAMYDKNCIKSQCFETGPP